MEVIKKVNKLSLMTSSSRANHVNAVLKGLNDACESTNVKVRVYDKEITFKNDNDRQIYCENFKEDPPEEYALSSEMIENLRGDGATIFMCANRDTRANKNTYFWSVSSASQRKEIKEENCRNVLDWHVNVLIYKDNELFYFDSALNPDALPKTADKIHFKSKLMDFLQAAKSNKIPIEKMFISGVANKVHGQCRCLSLKFIKDIVIEAIRKRPCTKYKFRQFVRGPRQPAISLMELSSLTL